jgi:uncharacterized protein YegL
MANSIIKTPQKGTTKTQKDISAILKGLSKVKMFDQLCLLVLDGSGSMDKMLSNGMKKANAVENATVELIKLLQKSSRSSGFHIGMVCYSSEPETRIHHQPISGINISKYNFNPMEGLGFTTRIDKALIEAEKITEAFLKSTQERSGLRTTVRILLMTDGYCDEPEKTFSIAEELKHKYQDKVRICSSLLVNEEETGWESAEMLLKSISSSDSKGELCYKRTISGSELRNFFERSSTED